MLKQFPAYGRTRSRPNREEIQKRLKARIQGRILGLIHAGRLKAGDRLPSIRQLAGETGADHRAVRVAYRSLEKDGIVEIRPKAGVFVAASEPEMRLLDEDSEWLAGILLDGRRRQISRMLLSDLLARRGSRLRCGCIESNRDYMVAICGELEGDFCMEPQPLFVEPHTAIDAWGMERLQGIDLVVTSVFHAELARSVAAQVCKPLVIITLHQDFSLEIDRRLRERPHTVVFEDPSYEARGRLHLASTVHADHVRFVTAHQASAERLDLARDDVLITRAARRSLGLEEYHLIPPPARTISTGSALELYRVLIQTWSRGCPAP